MALKAIKMTKFICNFSIEEKTLKNSSNMIMKGVSCYIVSLITIAEQILLSIYDFKSLLGVNKYPNK